MINKLNEQKKNNRTDTGISYLNMAGRMMILIALSTSVILLSAFYLGGRLDQIWGLKPKLTIVCCAAGVIGSAWINFRIAIRTAAALSREPDPASDNETEKERNCENG